MTTKDGKNVVASVLARLRNTAKSNGAPFQQVLQQYAIERFLYRISKSRHAKSAILKGALLLKTIGIPTARHASALAAWWRQQGHNFHAACETFGDLGERQNVGRPSKQKPSRPAVVIN